MESFNNKNWMAIPLKYFLSTAGESAHVDTRSLSSQLSDMTSRYNEIVCLHHKSEERMSRLEATMDRSEEIMTRLETSVLSISNNLNNLVQHLSKRQRIEDSSDNEHWDDKTT